MFEIESRKNNFKYEKFGLFKDELNRYENLNKNNSNNDLENGGNKTKILKISMKERVKNLYKFYMKEVPKSLIS